MSRRTLVLMMLACGGWCLGSSRATASAGAEYVHVLERGARMAACGDIFLLRSLWMKMTSSRSGRLGDDPRLTCHKHSVLSSPAGPLIGSQSSVVCNGVLLDLGVKATYVFLRRYYSDGGDR